jgi:hypothetical protein
MLGNDLVEGFVLRAKTTLRLIFDRATTTLVLCSLLGDPADLGSRGLHSCGFGIVYVGDPGSLRFQSINVM